MLKYFVVFFCFPIFACAQSWSPSLSGTLKNAAAENKYVFLAITDDASFKNAKMFRDEAFKQFASENLLFSFVDVKWKKTDYKKNARQIVLTPTFSPQNQTAIEEIGISSLGLFLVSPDNKKYIQISKYKNGQFNLLEFDDVLVAYNTLNGGGKSFNVSDFQKKKKEKKSDINPNFDKVCKIAQKNKKLVLLLFYNESAMEAGFLSEKNISEIKKAVFLSGVKLEDNNSNVELPKGEFYEMHKKLFDKYVHFRKLSGSKSFLKAILINPQENLEIEIPCDSNENTVAAFKKTAEALKKGYIAYHYDVIKDCLFYGSNWENLKNKAKKESKKIIVFNYNDYSWGIKASFRELPKISGSLRKNYYFYLWGENIFYDGKAEIEKYSELKNVQYGFFYVYDPKKNSFEPIRFSYFEKYVKEDLGISFL